MLRCFADGCAPLVEGRGVRRSIVAIGVGLAIVGAAKSARAEHVEARLRYELEKGAESCGSEGELRASVAERLGYDPFVEREGVSTVVVRVRGVGAGLEATIERRDPSGAKKGKPSTIASKSSNCGELLSAVAVATAIAVDPLSLGAEKSESLPPLPAEEPRPVSRPAPPAPPAPPDETGQPNFITWQRPSRTPPGPPLPTVVRFGAGPSMAAFALPAVSFGPRAFVGISHGIFELDLEGRYDAPVRYYAGRAYVEASLVLGTLAPCLRYSMFLSCAQLSLGALRGTGVGYDQTREDNTFYASIGVRQAVEFELARHLALRIAVDGAIALRPTHLEANDEVLWSTPTLAFSLSPMLVGHFP